MVSHAKPHHRSRSPEYRFNEHLRRYGLTATTFNMMLSAQNNLCAICSRPLVDRRSTHVDHKGDRVRGILCNGCNWGLGNFKDNVDALRAAVAYLERNL